MVLASRYPKALFNKSVYTDDNLAPIGYVAKETDDLVVIFSESDKKVRYDIPKSEIAVAGGSVIIQNSHSVLSRYKIMRSAPFPEGKISGAVAGEQGMEAIDNLKEAQPEKDEGTEKTETASVTTSSPQIVESLNLIITTDSKASRAKVTSTTAKNTSSGSPIKITSVEKFAPKEENKPSAISSQAGPSIPVTIDSAQSSETSGYVDIKKDDSTTTTVSSHGTKNNVTDLGTTSTTTLLVDNKAVQVEPLSEQQPLPEVKEQEQTPQVTSEPDHVSEAKDVNKMQASSTSSVLADSQSYFSNERETRSDEQGQLAPPDEESTSVVKRHMIAANYSPNSTTPWQAWLAVYNEFTTNAVRWTLKWFDLFWKLWTPTTRSAPGTNDNSNR
ncbi:MAG TPA: hypothetical protein VFI73_09920 [Candidatus Nitrosopolaris sp.]|nr:hypothetical protein [Candidatus Nitrosopolaris sp.]